MRHRVRALAVILVLVAQICLSVAAPLPAAADPSPAPCPSVSDVPAGLEAAFAFEIQSREILHFTSALAALPAPDQSRVFAAAMKAAGTAQERAAETALAATCPTLDATYGTARAMAVIASRWQLPELDDRHYEDLSAVVDAAVRALAAGDAVSPEVRREALLPFEGRLTSAPAVPASAGGCAQPNIDARRVTAFDAEYPALAVVAVTQGTVQVKVSLTDTGDVRSVELYHDTLGDHPGSVELIRASILAAGTSAYAPEVSNCRPVAGTYLFQIDYSVRRS